MHFIFDTVRLAGVIPHTELDGGKKYDKLGVKE